MQGQGRDVAFVQRQYGAPANERIILHNLELIDNFITDYCHTIFFMPMLQEALKYSYENKRIGRKLFGSNINDKNTENTLLNFFISLSLVPCSIIDMSTKTITC